MVSRSLEFSVKHIGGGWYIFVNGKLREMRKLERILRRENINIAAPCNTKEEAEEIVRKVEGYVNA